MCGMRSTPQTNMYCMSMSIEHICMTVITCVPSACAGGMAVPAVLLYLTRGMWGTANNPAVQLVKALVWEPNVMVALLVTGVRIPYLFYLF